jgi:hypothetical protein
MINIYVRYAVLAVATCSVPAQRSAAGVEPVEQVGTEQLLLYFVMLDTLYQHQQHAACSLTAVQLEWSR